MSKITLEPNSSGAGTFSIVSPDSNTNRTLNLPDASGNIIAADASTGRFDSSNMPAGSVIQVVSALSTNGLSSTSSTYAELPGMVLSITPRSTSSKILVMASVHVYTNSQSGYGGGGVQINRNGTPIISDEDYYGLALTSDNPSGRMMAYNVKQVLDTPALTSAVEYKCLGARIRGNDNDVRFNIDNFSAPGTLTLMEIAG